MKLHIKKTPKLLRMRINREDLSKMRRFLSTSYDSYLDAGCGEGDFTKILAKEINPKRIYGVDNDIQFLSSARKKGLIVKKANIERRIPFKDNSLDVVISRQVIEHLVNPDRFLQETYRVLKAGGIVIITTPNLACWFNRIIFLFGIQPFFLESSTIDKTNGLRFTRQLTAMREPMGHIRVFTRGALNDILEMHNFQVIKILGSEVAYLPGFMKPFDRLFSKFSSLASDLMIVAQKC